MDWKSVDERLIRRGELLLSLDFLERYDDELRDMNRGEEGRPPHPNVLSHPILGYR